MSLLRQNKTSLIILCEQIFLIEKIPFIETERRTGNNSMERKWETNMKFGRRLSISTRTSKLIWKQIKKRVRMHRVYIDVSKEAIENKLKNQIMESLIDSILYKQLVQVMCYLMINNINSTVRSALTNCIQNFQESTNRITGITC